MTDYRFLGIERDAYVVRCTLSNPPRHTLVAAEVAELAALLNALEGDAEVRVLVFTGAGDGVFIAHYEVNELAESAAASRRVQHPPPPGEGLELHALHRLILGLGRARFVTVAAINGNTAGGGLEFALGCDFRLALDGPYRLGLPETSVGIIPGAGGTQRFARLLGTARALDLILHGETVSPARALELGLVHRVYGAADFRAEVDAFARNLASRAPIALAAAKRAIREGSELTLEAGLAVEQREFERCMRTEDAAVAMRSFLASKPWRWQGR